MKLTYRISGLSAGLLSTLMFLVTGGATVLAADAKFEAQLIWGANEESQDPKLKPVDDEVRKKLGDLPLKWKHYYLVKREAFAITANGTNFVTMSERCTLEVKRESDTKVVVALHGHDGNVCARRKQPLPEGEMLVLGGNAPNSTAWLVTLKRVK